MQQQVIVNQAGDRFQSVILDGNTVVLLLFIWFRNNTDPIQFPFMTLWPFIDLWNENLHQTERVKLCARFIKGVRNIMMDSVWSFSRTLWNYGLDVT